jgi:hypothetical protein
MQRHATSQFRSRIPNRICVKPRHVAPRCTTSHFCSRTHVRSVLTCVHVVHQSGCWQQRALWLAAAVLVLHSMPSRQTHCHCALSFFSSQPSAPNPKHTPYPCMRTRLAALRFLPLPLYSSIYTLFFHSHSLLPFPLSSSTPLSSSASTLFFYFRSLLLLSLSLACRVCN